MAVETKENQDEKQEDGQEEVAQESKEAPMTLTPREEAIARGDDPDALDSHNQEFDEAAEGDAEEEEGYEALEDGDDSGAQESDSTPEEGGTSDSSWITEDIKGFAGQYGLNEAELGQFQSFDQFNSMTKIAQKIYDHDVKPSGEEESQEASEPQEPDESFLDPEEFSEDEYNSATASIAKAIRGVQEKQKEQEARIDAREKDLEAKEMALTEERNVEQVNKYHDIVDKHRPEFYGNTIDQKGNYVTLEQKEAGRRVKLFKAVESVARFYADSDAGKVPDREALVKQAEQLAFGDELKKWDSRSKGQRLRQQSNRRRRVGATRSVGQAAEPLSDNDEAEILAKDPDVLKFWNDAQRASGVS